MIRRINASQGNLPEESIKTNVNINTSFLLGNKRIPPMISCPIYKPTKQLDYEEQMIPSILYHKNPKYGASKYTSSLQVGKMHKIIASQ